MRVLTVNAGSSSLKVALVADGVVEGTFDELPAPAPAVDAVGHRIVHGGTEFVAPTVIDEQVERRLRELTDLAPLHQPKSLSALDAARRLLPDVPHIGCFDTAFHATMPAEAYTYALPKEWREQWPIRRFGFHGLSHSWSAHRTRQLLPQARRVVVCHLGAGGSVTAVLDGESVDTTMGFTPLDGLVMATRCGSLDPGLVTWLEEHAGLSAREVTDALEHRSGLLGLSGSADMAEILSRHDPEARLAIEVYLHRLASAIAAMTASLGGIDVLVFTGGVGERSAEIRRRCCERVGYLGVDLDAALNADARPDCAIAAADATCQVLVIAAHEELEIARLVETTLRPR
jgi:acetate kinase